MNDKRRNPGSEAFRPLRMNGRLLSAFAILTAVLIGTASSGSLTHTAFAAETTLQHKPKPRPKHPAAHAAETAAAPKTDVSAAALPPPAALTAPALTTPALTTPAGDAPAPGTVAATAPAPPKNTFSLSVSWDRPVAAAIFHRAGYLWMVFDRHQDVDIALMRRLGGSALSLIEQLPDKQGTVIRMIVQPDYQALVRKDGLLWVVDLADRPSQAKTPIAVESPAKFTNGTGIALNVADAGAVVTVKDPEVGDTLLVVPVMPVGAGVYPGRDTTDLNILPTLQGIALVPHIDDLDIRPSRTGVAIVRASGAPLTLSAVPKASGDKNQDADQGFLNVAAWKGGDPDDYAKRARAIEDDLANVTPTAKAKAHLDAARFFFANGYAAECLGYLRIAAGDEPTMVDTGPYRALRGACEGLLGYWDQAKQDFDNPLVANDADSQFWRAAAHAVTDPPPEQWDKSLASGMARLHDYPPRLAAPLAGIIATVALKAGDDASAHAAIDVLDKNAQNDTERDWVNYLNGAYSELRGKFDVALAQYAKAEAGLNREARARAGLADIELQLKLKRISAADAADRMDHMRFAWRDEAFEFALLKRLGQLQTQAGEYPEALRTLRSLADTYPDRKDIGDIRTMMVSTFTKLYADGGADSLPPVTAIGLYDEFRDLTPDGPQGDEMIRKLADRLASVDLLERASILLKYQVDFRLQGLEKAKVGTRLTLLDILDKRPNDALAVLNASVVDGIPPELTQERARLQARALADIGKPADAITALAGDTSQEAGLLRAEIFWRSGDWMNAALAFQALVPPPAQGTVLTDDQAKLILSCAAALSMAGDERSIVALARNYGPAMAATSLKDPFVLFTSPPDRQMTDMPGLAVKIKQAQGFKTFIDAYKDKMKSSSLSAIN